MAFNICVVTRILEGTSPQTTFLVCEPRPYHVTKATLLGEPSILTLAMTHDLRVVWPIVIEANVFLVDVRVCLMVVRVMSAVFGDIPATTVTHLCAVPVVVPRIVTFTLSLVTVLILVARLSTLWHGIARVT